MHEGLPALSPIKIVELFYKTKLQSLGVPPPRVLFTNFNMQI